MKSLALLISPLAKSAYFNDYLDVCKIELAGLVGDCEIEHHVMAAMDFFYLQASDELLPELARLSFVYGIFERIGEQLLPLSIDANFMLHQNFVFGAKFKGKTNEMLTQMLINVGLQHIDYKHVADVKLLDPMCGRATTLLWAMRYGMKCKGIEQDRKALDDIRQNVKKWCKVHRQKHKLTEGHVSKAIKHGRGKFLDFAVNDASMRVIHGDSTQASALLKNEKFHLIVSDLPYGVQHFTTDKTRNSLDVVADCAQGWIDSLKPGGAIVLSFNRYIPKRDELIGVFTEKGLQDSGFSAAHRMSESIVRDVIILTKPA